MITYIHMMTHHLYFVLRIYCSLDNSILSMFEIVSNGASYAIDISIVSLLLKSIEPSFYFHTSMSISSLNKRMEYKKKNVEFVNCSLRSSNMSNRWTILTWFEFSENIYIHFCKICRNAIAFGWYEFNKRKLNLTVFIEELEMMHYLYVYEHSEHTKPIICAEFKNIVFVCHKYLLRFIYKTNY